MSAGCGFVGVLTGSASVAGRLAPLAMLRREGCDVVMLSDELVGRWETVYAEYGQASEMVNRSVPGDHAVAREMARASGNVALVWRQMAAESGMPWWSVAALSAAAQAFEFQARDWTARAKYGVHPSTGGLRGRGVYPVAGRHEQGEDGGSHAV